MLIDEAGGLWDSAAGVTGSRIFKLPLSLAELISDAGKSPNSFAWFWIRSICALSLAICFSKSIFNSPLGADGEILAVKSPGSGSAAPDPLDRSLCSITQNGRDKKESAEAPAMRVRWVAI